MDGRTGVRADGRAWRSGGRSDVDGRPNVIEVLDGRTVALSEERTDSRGGGGHDDSNDLHDLSNPYSRCLWGSGDGEVTNKHIINTFLNI